jgi:Tol biopolymer transport system component
MKQVLTVTLVVAGFVFLVPAPLFSGAAGATTRTNGQIVFDRLVNPSIGSKSVWTANPDGTNAQQLLPVNPISCCGAFSPNGRKLAIPYPAKGGRVGTAVINPDGSGLRPFPIKQENLNVGCATWSPNGKRLACETWDDKAPARDGVYTISSANGGGLTRLTSNPIGGHDLPGSYSPNGKQLVFTRFDKTGNTGIGLFIVNTNGSHEHRLTPKGILLDAGNSGDWSPQGNLIIFSRSINGPGELWAIQPNGTHAHPLIVQGLPCGTTVGCHEPIWSPDGKKIIFAENGIGPTTQIYTINANGTGLENVTAGDDPTWGTHPLTP